MYICYELREYEDGQLINEVITRNSSNAQEQASFELKFENLTTDEIHHIWELTDKYLQIKMKNNN